MHTQLNLIYDMRTISPNPSYLTVIVPVYNEEESLPRVYQKLSEFIIQSKKSINVLFVNDGSTDNSLNIIEKICSVQQQFHYISLDRNQGLSTALKAGIDTIESPYIGYIDADLQTSPMDFNKLLEYCESYELVTGIRQDRQDSNTKVISSRIANKLRRWVTNDGVSDTGCPLKIIKRESAEKIPFFKGMHRFLPALVLLQKGRVKEVPVSHFERIEGQAKYHLWNRLLGPLADLIAFSWIKRRYINYTIEKSDQLTLHQTHASNAI